MNLQLFLYLIAVFWTTLGIWFVFAARPAEAVVAGILVLVALGLVWWYTPRKPRPTH